MKFKFLLILLFLISFDKLFLIDIRNKNQKIYHQNLDKIREEIISLKADNKNCYEFVDNNSLELQRKLEAKNYNFLFGNINSKLVFFNVNESQNLTEEVILPVTKLIMKQNKIDRLKINYKYVFIKCLNKNDMLISVSNKFRKGPIINYIFN